MDDREYYRVVDECTRLRQENLKLRAQIALYPSAKRTLWIRIVTLARRLRRPIKLSQAWGEE